jgi:SAM-dependent methyltransferase
MTAHDTRSAIDSDSLRDSGTEDRLNAVERGLAVFRSGVVPSADGEILPPVGYVADFLTEATPESIRAKAIRDRLPVPDVANRELYNPGGDHLAYWRSGLEDFEKVVAAVDSHGKSGYRILDFGGATGRVFRHFYCQDRRYDVWSSDFKLSNFRWNQLYLPSDIHLLLNTFIPSLPLPDRYFDVITAFSVFTHIDELESPWLLELRRVLKPDGLLYVTIHDEEFWEVIPPWLLEVIQRSSAGRHLTPGSPFPGPRSAFPFTDESLYSCNTFHSHDYVRSQWSRYFDIVEIRPRHSQSQCVVLLTYGG